MPIAGNHRGRIDLAHLERELVRHAGRPLRIGSFSAASNVTGRISDTDAVSELLHRHGALACWDYATAGPHLEIRMRPAAGRPLSGKDAVFLSPHKFPGGPGTPGVLVVRRDLVRNPVPTVPGGGTISYVHAAGQHYLADPSHREEGGTPAIMESIRAGLAFKLKQAVGTEVIVERESDFVRRAIASWRTNPAIQLLGELDEDRLPIVSFVVRLPNSRQLHHNFVVALLSDLFGIQARAGAPAPGLTATAFSASASTAPTSSPAGPSKAGSGSSPAGRMSFSYYQSEAEFQYIVEAVHLVASHGARLLPDYRFDPRSGLWSHQTAPAQGPDLDELSFDRRLHDGALLPSAGGRRGPQDGDLAAYLREAAAVLTARPAHNDQPAAVMDYRLDRMRWFELPGVCLTTPGSPDQGRGPAETEVSSERGGTVQRFYAMLGSASSWSG